MPNQIQAREPRLNRRTIAFKTLLLGAWAASVALAPLPSAQALPARFGLSPDNSRDLLLETINGARSSLLINIYSFDNDSIFQALRQKILSGVRVRILVEGEPVGRISPEGIRVLEQLRNSLARTSASTSSRLFVMTNATDATQPRRYVYNHAKYVVADGVRSLVSSENFGSNGHPKPGHKGNRGWETVIESRVLAARLAEVFAEDTDLSHGDVVRIGRRDEIPLPPEAVKPETDPNAAREKEETPVRTVGAIGMGGGDVDAVSLITSPHSEEALVRLLRSARESIDLEQMSFPSTWKADDGTEMPSPFVQELIAAAGRGVQVRLLVNPDTIFNPNPPAGAKLPNTQTVQLLETLARCRRIPLAGKLIDSEALDITYIHNKGVIVDGERVLVSSINGTRNSVENNREVAVLLDSTDAGDYYGRAFSLDWRRSAEFERRPDLPTNCRDWEPKTGLDVQFFRLF